jgi:hypothetical protein
MEEAVGARGSAAPPLRRPPPTAWRRRSFALAGGFVVTLLFVGAAWLWWRAATGDFRLVPLPYARYWLTVWASAAVGGTAYWAVTRDGWRAAGLGIMSVPLWIAVWGFVNSIPRLADPQSFIPARSRYDLSTNYMRSLLIDLGYLGTGFLAWTARDGIPASARGLAVRLHDAVAVTVRRRGEASGAAAGWVWFPVVLGVTIALDFVVRNQTPQLINGDESQVWKNMTLYHAGLVSAAAAVTEELVYRALLLTLAVRALARAGLPASAAAAGGVVAQAVLFGLAHGGYGTIIHVLGPFLFGIVAGAATLRYGIWSAIALHFLIDFYIFATYAVPSMPWLAVALWILLLANVATTVLVAGRWVARRAAAPR